MIDLPTCPASGKMSLTSRLLPPHMRTHSRSKKGKLNTKWFSTYKCKTCPYYHQTSEL